MKQTAKDILAGTIAGILLAIFLFCGICEAATVSNQCNVWWMCDWQE